MRNRLRVVLPLAFCGAALGANPQQTTRPVILPVTDASDIRFIHVSFGAFKREPAYNRVHGIAQDNEGFLWFVSQDKLQRYDGYEIREYPEGPNGPGSVYTEESLLIDRRGILWGGWESGVDRFDPANDAFRRSVPTEGPFKSRVLSTYEDREGVLWFSTNGGLTRMDAETGRTIRYEHRAGDPASLSSNICRGAFESKDGNFWVATTKSVDLFDRRTARVLQHIPIPPDFPNVDPNPELHIKFVEDQAGVLWMIFSYGYGLARVNRETGTLTFYSLDGAGKDNTLQGGARSIVELDDGTLWIGTTSSGILKLNRERTHFVRYRNNAADPNSLSGDQVHALFLDREGNMWAGTNGAGINRFSPRPLPFKVYQHRVGDANSLDMNYTTSIFEDSHGELWFGSLRALGRLNRETGRMTFYRKTGGSGDLSSTWVISIAEDLSGYLWFGTVGAGVNRLDPRTGKFKVFRYDPADPHSLSHNTVQKILVDHKGTVWVGTEDGLDKFDEATQSFRVYKAGHGLNESRVDEMAEDLKGDLWIATQRTGLARFNPKNGHFTTWRQGSQPGSLSSDITNSVCVDHNGTIWVGTQNGLNRFDPATETFRVYSQRDGLASSSVSRMLEDERGDLWVSTSNGLSRFDAGKKTFRNYYVSDGIAGNEFYNYASAFKSRGGEMFFSSYAGVTAFFPRDVIDNPYVPPVILTDFRVSGKSLPAGGDSPLSRTIPFTRSVTLSHTQGLISLQFSALSFTNPDGNRYRYRMENLEDSWNESDGAQRFITYSLSPGRYVFRVKGSNSRGTWNEEGASLQIVILPPWWSTAWFRASFVIAVLLSLGALYRRRLHQIAWEFDMRLDERTRIARDLHDTLLQSFHGIMLRFQAAHNLLPGRAADAKEVLETALDDAAHAITDARDAVQDLRGSIGVANGLATVIEALGQQMAQDRTVEDQEPPAFSVEVEGAVQDLHPILRDEVYRITGEALRNAFRHARARRVEVEIRYDAQKFRVRVRDDGMGMDKSVLHGGREGHWGLPGMRERAKGTGGQLEVWSQQGAGTEVELTIPASVAYGSNTGRRFHLFRSRVGTDS